MELQRKNSKSKVVDRDRKAGTERKNGQITQGDQRVQGGQKIQKEQKNHRMQGDHRNQKDQRNQMNLRMQGELDERKKNRQEDKNQQETKKQQEAKKQQNMKAAAKICPAARKCGGCQWLSKPYEQQLQEKNHWIKEKLQDFCSVEPILGMKNPKQYRYKVHAVFGEDNRHNPISGTYREGSHEIVPIDSCLLENKKADAIIVSIRKLLKSFKIRPYLEDRGQGLLRHVLVRVGYQTGEIMVVLVLASQILPGKKNFVKALRELHPEITTMIINVNPKPTTMVLGDREEVIFGKGYIEDILCEKKFRISPKSFYQVNPVQAQVLYQKALSMAKLKPDDVVIDAYCGTGTIGILASQAVKKVIGVELSKEAVMDARINAKQNNTDNVKFYVGDAGEFLTAMAEDGDGADVVFLDPPRKGCSEAFLSALCQLKPSRILYISCNPITQATDMAYLAKNGYRAEKGVAVDMFPFTNHVETVVLMSRKDT
jgi:23S rRNA (uracil1939-C5)-methyltransferase